MATSSAAMRVQLGRVATQSRISRIRSFPTKQPWICRQCTQNTPAFTKISRRTFYTSSANDETNKVPTAATSRAAYLPLDTFARRHIGPDVASTGEMLRALDPPVSSLDEFVKQVLPADILSSKDLHIDTVGNGADQGFTESQLLARLRSIASENKIMRSYIGCGYAGTRVPEVIKRNVLESPGWYTSYTPYQPEISQGRLESLLNFQTLVADLTALAISNASLLDESTAAAEAMTLSLNALPASRQKAKNKTFFVSHLVHPQTIAVLQSRADGFNIKIQVGDVLADGGKQVKDLGKDLIGALVQYPDTEGGVEDFKSLANIIHDQGATFSVATDLLALTVLTPPGEFGADIAFGNAQRFGVPFGYGGPHAAFFAVSDKYKRKIPGRLIGVSKDRLGDRAMRLALQTREQHIRREKATSNVCTAQALLANMSAFYAVYHGPEGLKNIAQRAINGARIIEQGLTSLGYETGSNAKGEDGRVLFDTVVVNVGQGNSNKILHHAVETQGINFRRFDDSRLGITIDETVDLKDLEEILAIFKEFSTSSTVINIEEIIESLGDGGVPIPAALKRTSKCMTSTYFKVIPRF